MHLLISRKPVPFRSDRGSIVEEFNTYDEALAAYEALDGFNNDLAVRDGDDPQWKNLPGLARSEENQKLIWAARRAARQWRDDEIGRTARRIIGTYGASTFSRLHKLLSDDLNNRGLNVHSHDVEDALKRRMLVGRCWTCDRAYWMPKKQGPLHKARCNVCGSQLHQTTLALRKPFFRLAA